MTQNKLENFFTYKKTILFVIFIVETILNSFLNQFSAVYQVGGVEVQDYLYKATSYDVSRLGLFALLLLTLLYGLFFKKILLGILPFVTSFIVLIGTGEAIALIGVPVNVLCSIILVLVFSVGAMECAHFINVYQCISREHPGASRSFCAAQTLHHIFWSIFLAGATTVVGLLCNMMTPFFLRKINITKQL